MGKSPGYDHGARRLGWRVSTHLGVVGPTSHRMCRLHAATVSSTGNSRAVSAGDAALERQTGKSCVHHAVLGNGSATPDGTLAPASGAPEPPPLQRRR